METNVRDGTGLLNQDFVRDVRIDIKLYLETLNETTVRNLTKNYFSTEVTTSLLYNSDIFTSSTVTAFFCSTKIRQEVL